MGQIGRYLVLFGAALALTGVLLLAGEKLGLGKLPGDFVVRKKHGTFYFLLPARDQLDREHRAHGPRQPAPAPQVSARSRGYGVGVAFLTPRELSSQSSRPLMPSR
jgi:hypothetical protein